MRVEHVYVYNWANNPKRASMKGRRCRITARATHGTTIEIEFEDNAQREIVSRRSLRQVEGHID